MQRRQQYLIGGLVFAFLAWSMSGWVDSVVFQPFRDAAKNVEETQKSVKTKSDEKLALLRAQKSLKEFKATCLPPDAGKGKERTAMNAQRRYTDWLTDLAQLCGFESLRVNPNPPTRTPIYISVMERVEAEARYEQLVMFLDLFYRTDLLHRITAMQVSTKVFDGDPLLKVTLDVEGIALVDAPPRKTLFPQTTLEERLDDSATKIKVGSLEGFPKEPGFRVQVKNEFLKVTEIDGTTWTVERGVERTRPDGHPEGSYVELIPLNPKQSDRSLADFQKLVASNIFVKPAPQSKIKISPSTEKTFVRGRPNDFTFVVSGYNSSKGKPEFKLVDAPEGVKLEKSGKLSWNPNSSVEFGKYPVKFELHHASLPGGVMTETLTIRVRDSGKAPRLTAAKPEKAYLNRKWSFRPELAADSPTGRFTWKVERPPQGMTVNDRTGELKWTPADDTEIGEMTVSLVATDGDTPPQSTTFSLKLEVEDDAAQFTRLTGIFAKDGKKRIFLTDQSTSKKLELHEGDTFAIAELAGKIKEIGRRSVMIDLGTREARWDIGQSLREVEESIQETASRSFD